MRMRRHERGAALLTAMVIVTLVATLAAAMVWQQWRAVQAETIERSRIQSAWILSGALDWARLILREDTRAGGPDHLGEPWAVPLAEARLSSFLAVDKNLMELLALVDALKRASAASHRRLRIASSPGITLASCSWNRLRRL